MKKLIHSLVCLCLAAGIISVSSCTKNISVPYSFPEKQVCLKDTTTQFYITDEFDVSSADINTAIKAGGLTAEQVKSVKLKDGLKASVVTTGATLSKIKSIELYMKVKGTSGVGDQVAYTDAVGTGTEVVLKLTGKELKELTSKDLTFTVKVLNDLDGNGAMCLKLTSGTLEISGKK